MSYTDLMCGFAGVIAWDEKYRVSRETLAKMSAAIAHRGPDGEGFHFSDESPITPDRPQVALAFRRLAILDPNPRSMQPFTDGRHWLVFNGEIYNFRELKKELSQLRPDYEWKTTGDTEVLLRAYAVWGEKCVEHLNGMFAFAVWDEAEKSLFLARDRMGQKPLYWAAMTVEGTFWLGAGSARANIEPALASLSFGSELPALFRLPWMAKQIDLDALNGYLRWGYVPLPRTAFMGIRNFYPSLCGTVRRDSVTASTYFNRSGVSGKVRVAPHDATEETREQLLRASGVIEPWSALSQTPKIGGSGG